MAKKKEQKAELLLEETEKESSKLDVALKALEKDFGKGVVIGGKDKPNYVDIISTGSIGLDSALGIGGLPLGKIVEFLGWESSGKSTLTLHLIANAQAKGYKCLLVDGENSFDEKYARALGVKPEDILYVQLDGEGGEKAYEVAQRLIATGDVQLCIIDSVSALQPKKVIQEGLTSSTMGLHSRMMGQVCPQFNVVTQKNNCLCVFVSQMREKIGVMFGSPETTQGGNALKFYAHIRVDIRKQVLKDGDEAYANKTKVKIIKNKMAPPFKTAEFNINFGEGIDRIDEVLSLGASTGILRKYGKNVTLLDNGAGGETKWTLEEFYKELREPERPNVLEGNLYNSLKRLIIEKLASGQTEEKGEDNEG